MAVYFTADTHFGHKNVLSNSNRPFCSVDLMNETIFRNWAEKLQPSDTIYHLGDVAFGNREAVRGFAARIRELPGTKFLVPGNHDWRYPGELFAAFDKVLPPIYELTVSNYRLVLCHYPMLDWNGRSRGTLQLFGHVHNTYYGNSQQANVGVDAFGFAPVRLEVVLARIRRFSDGGFSNAEAG